MIGSNGIDNEHTLHIKKFKTASFAELNWLKKKGSMAISRLKEVNSQVKQTKENSQGYLFIIYS